MTQKQSLVGRLFGRHKKTSAEEPVDENAAAAGTPVESIDTPLLSPSKTIEDAESDAAPLSIAPAPTHPPRSKGGLLTRLTNGLARSSTKFSQDLSGIFTQRRLDDAALEELEDLLITADLGPAATGRITATLAKNRFDKKISADEVRQVLATEVATTLTPLERPLTIDSTHKPHIILMAGVNGAGKTTTIGKLARQYKDAGKSVMLAAGDTFRAAAVDQLVIWGERAGAQTISRDIGADAAGLVYDALRKAKDTGIDVLLIDTAGRLQNRSELMAELAKIVRVIKKIDHTAPHDTILVLDATVGQNAISQAKAFQDVAGVSGIIMTKLDGTARGGVLVALGEQFNLPIHYIGIGENVEDLQRFNANDFAKALVGIS